MLKVLTYFACVLVCVGALGGEGATDFDNLWVLGWVLVSVIGLVNALCEYADSMGE